MEDVVLTEDIARNPQVYAAIVSGKPNETLKKMLDVKGTIFRMSTRVADRVFEGGKVLFRKIPK